MADVDPAISNNNSSTNTHFNMINNQRSTSEMLYPSSDGSNHLGQPLNPSSLLGETNSGSNKTTASKSGVYRILEFGRELFEMSQRLEKENGPNENNQRMLEVRSIDNW